MYYILFGHPRMWKTHKWWDSQLLNPKTYNEVYSRVKWISSIYKSIEDLSYLILTDTDTWLLQKKIDFWKKEVSRFPKQFYWEVYCFPAEQCIENRFVLWLTADSLLIKNLSKFKEILKKIIDKSYKVKKSDLLCILWKHKRNAETIWYEMWSNISIDILCWRSSNFKMLYEHIVNKKQS
jgi:hypothetical protein